MVRVFGIKSVLLCQHWSCDTNPILYHGEERRENSNNLGCLGSLLDQPSAINEHKHGKPARSHSHSQTRKIREIFPLEF